MRAGHLIKKPEKPKTLNVNVNVKEKEKEYAGDIKKEKIFYSRAIVSMIFSMFLMAEKIENFFLSQEKFQLEFCLFRRADKSFLGEDRPPNFFDDYSRHQINFCLAGLYDFFINKIFPNFGIYDFFINKFSYLDSIGEISKNENLVIYD